MRHPRRRGAALPAAAAVVLVAAAVTALSLLPSAARAQESTEFKPASVRFIAKRTTTVFPTLDAARAAGLADGAAAARAGNPAEAKGREAVGGRAGVDGGTGGGAAAAAEEQRRAWRAAAAEAAGARAAADTAADAADAEASPTAAGRRRLRQAAAAPAAAKASSSSSSNKPAAAGSIRRAWNAINANDQVGAIGNPSSFAYDPPDEAFAVSAKHALSGVNTATRVYDAKTGAPLSPTIDYTVLMGLPPYVGQPFGPEPCGDIVVDPTALYDPETRRWFQTIARVGLNQASCDETGDFWVEVAVSATPSPLGKWHVYSIYASNNGQQGSPLVEGCEFGCFADFPRAQLDPNVLVITTNNFAAGHSFVGVGVFVLDKFALARGKDQVALAEFALKTAGEWDNDAPLQSISPAYVPPRKLDDDDDRRGKKTKKRGHGRRDKRKRHDTKKKDKKGGGGSDGPAPAWKAPFLLLSHSLDDPYRLIRFVLTGTRAVKAAVTQPRLDALAAALTLTATPVALPSEPAIVKPPLFYNVALQPEVGNFPFGSTVLNEPSPGPIGAGADRLLSSSVGGGRHVGVFAVLLEREEGPAARAVYLAQLDAETGAVLRGDILREPGGGDLTWPAVALDRRGRGAVVCSASSLDLYMSVAAFTVAGDRDGAVGDQQIAVEGRGLLDTFTTYSIRPRAGDYAVAVIEAESGLLWGAAEYVAEMSCDDSEFEQDPTCGGTRTRVTNWWTGVFAMSLA